MLQRVDEEDRTACMHTAMVRPYVNECTYVDMHAATQGPKLVRPRRRVYLATMHGVPTHGFLFSFFFLP